MNRKKTALLNRSSDSVANASIVQIGSKCFNAFFHLIITMILARLLTPEEYGTVAILVLFTGFFSIISDAGISSAIIQFKDLTEEDYAKLFFFSLLFGIVLALSFLFVSLIISIVYENSIYVPLGAILMVSVLSNALNMVPNGLLLKDRKFILIGLRLVICTLVVGIVTIGLAYMGFGCYAIVMQSVFTSASVLIWNLISTGLKLSIGDFRPVLKKVGSYSAFQFGDQAIGWFANSVDSLLAGKMFGPAALGYYNKAYSLYGYPMSLLASSITGTLRPFLAVHQNDMDAMYDRFVGIAKKLSILAALCTIEMSICADELVGILFGGTWMPASPLLAILSLAIYARSMNGAHAPLLASSNRTDLLMLSTSVNTAITCMMIALGGYLGSIEALAICVAIAYNFEMLLPVYLGMRKCVKKSISDYVKNFIPEISAAVITYVVASLISWGMDNIFLSLIAKAVMVCVCFVSLCCVFGQKRHFVDLLNKIIRI